MQDAPQVWRDGAAAYYRGELISLFTGCARRLLAAELLYALVDRLRFCGRRRGSARALQRRVEVCWLDLGVGWRVFLGHGSAAERALGRQKLLLSDGL